MVSSSAMLFEAMQRLEAGSLGFALVVDANDRLVGVITDGDVRRAILGGAQISDPVLGLANRKFTYIEEAQHRQSPLLAPKAGLKFVPIVDANLVPKAIYVEGVPGERLPNRAVILAGGRGTRLHPVTADFPKPMLEVHGRPVLEHIIGNLVQHGIVNIVLSVNFRADIIKTYFKDGAKFGCNISYLEEPIELGTGGPLSLMDAAVSDPMIVVNGDIFTVVDYAELLAFHASQAASATICSGMHQVPVPFAVLSHRDGYVEKLEEKPTFAYAVNRGIYVLDSEALTLVPKNTYFPITDLFGQLLASGKRVANFNLDAPWFDIGTSEDLDRARHPLALGEQH